jgi:hypothetical protein
MSQQEWFDLQALVHRHSLMVSEQEAKRDSGVLVPMSLNQMKFIISLRPIGPLAGFIDTLDKLMREQS